MRRANAVPEVLVHRVIVRESRYQPKLVGRGGTIGLMQIKLATARGLGYGGDAEGLRDPDTNLTYGVKYLAGAYRAANGDHARAIHYYAGRLLRGRQAAAARTARAYGGIDSCRQSACRRQPARQPKPRLRKTPPTPSASRFPQRRARCKPATRRVDTPRIGLH